MVEIEHEQKLRVFTDKRLSEEVPGDTLGDDFKGYVFKITGGFDKQGFAMVQGVATNGRVRVMLDGSTGMYTPKRPGCRKRKSIRGCIVGNDLSCINLVIVKKGPTDLPGLTDPDSNKPSMRGPKRANKIRKLWGLTKDDDVRLFVPKRKITREGKKDYVKSPKIQKIGHPCRPATQEEACCPQTTTLRSLQGPKGQIRTNPRPSPQGKESIPHFQEA